MDIIDTGEEIRDEFETLEKIYNDYEFFFLHIKKTDSLGEDGDFYGKVKKLEEVDREIGRIKKLEFGAIAITGDHSTPSILKSHSWHPVPLILLSKNTIPDNVEKFTERECAKGILGKLYAKELMYLLLACSLKLKKFGA